MPDERDLYSGEGGPGSGGMANGGAGGNASINANARDRHPGFPIFSRADANPLVCRGSWEIGCCGGCRRCLDSAPAYIKQLKSEMAAMKEAQPPFVTLIDGLTLNRHEVSSITVTNTTYAFGAPTVVLEVTMKDGSRHRLKHEPQYLNGADVYLIEKRLKGIPV